MKSIRIIYRGLLISFITVTVFLLLNCGGGGGGSSSDGTTTDDSNTDNGDTSTTTEVSQEIGAEGGTLTDPDGSSITIPAGALDSVTTISISTFQDPASISEEFGATPFTGGADFGPDGTQFLQPATITIPTAKELIPGRQYALLYYDDANDSWHNAESALTVNENGKSLSGQVTHFTPYVNSLLPPDIHSKFSEYFDGTNGNVALGSYIAWFLSASGLYGYVADTKNAKYKAVGINFHVNYEIDDLEDSVSYLHGIDSGTDYTSLTFHYDYTDSDDKIINYDLLVTIHWEVTEKDLHVSIVKPLPGNALKELEEIIVLTSGVSDLFGISKVDFYVDGLLIGTDTSEPYSCIWDTVSYLEEDHTLKAVITDTDGGEVESDPVVITVQQDQENPIPGNSGLLSISHDVSTNLSLQWNLASDETTTQELLEYQVMRSEAASMGDVESALANGAVLQGWSANSDTFTIAASTLETDYYYTVLVRDETGNMAHYQQKVAPIVLEGTLIPPGTYYFHGGTSASYKDFGADGSYERYLESSGSIYNGTYSQTADGYLCIYTSCTGGSITLVTNGVNLHELVFLKTSGPELELQGEYVHRPFSGLIESFRFYNADGSFIWNKYVDGVFDETIVETDTWTDNGDNTYSFPGGCDESYCSRTVIRYAFILFNGDFYQVDLTYSFEYLDLDGNPILDAEGNPTMSPFSILYAASSP